MERYIVEFPNAIPEGLCKHLIQKFEKDPRKVKGVIGSDPNSKHVDERMKKAMEIHITGTPGWEQEDVDLSICIKNVVTKYINHICNEAFKETDNKNLYRDIFYSEFYDTGYEIQRIARGDSYAWHHDGCVVDGGRVCNILMYLNTLEEHEGGKTEIINGTKIRPEAGKVVIFPSSWTFPHRGNAVNADYKYICCTMLRAKVPEKFST